MKILRVAVVMALLLGTGTWVAPAAGAESAPWITVEKVMVNKLGGVTVEGLHSAASIYEQLRTEVGLVVSYEDEQGWHFTTIYADEDDVVIIGSNPDNFVVHQPAGRRTMVRAEHESSRLQWVFSNAAAGSCDPCRWVTDRYGYDSSEPLFVYSPDGKFKAGWLTVDVADIGYWIEIYESDGTTPKASGTWQDETFTQRTIRAVSYRG